MFEREFSVLFVGVPGAMNSTPEVTRWARSRSSSSAVPLPLRTPKTRSCKGSVMPLIRLTSKAMPAVLAAS